MNIENTAKLIRRYIHLKKLALIFAFALFSHAALAEDTAAETKAEADIADSSQAAQVANLALQCHLRNFDWVSAVNSMVLERVASDAEALKRAGLDSDDIRTQWEMIARDMTLNWGTTPTHCDQIASDASNLDALAVKGGYSSNPVLLPAP